MSAVPSPRRLPRSFRRRSRPSTGLLATLSRLDDDPVLFCDCDGDEDTPGDGRQCAAGAVSADHDA
jgi:hypothetical protein